MGFGLGIEEVDCLFESRSSTGGGCFLGPPTPLPPFPQGFGFPPGVRASPRGQGPPGVRASRPAARLLPSFHPCFPRTGGPGFTLYFPEVRARLPCFQVSGAGARASALLPALLSGDRWPGPGFQAPGLPLCFHTFRGPGARLPPCFQEAMLSGGFQEAMLPQGFPGSGHL